MVFPTIPAKIPFSSAQASIASITKVGVGLAAMALYEDGVADLDQSIGAYWDLSMALMVMPPAKYAPVAPGGW